MSSGDEKVFGVRLAEGLYADIFGVPVSYRMSHFNCGIGGRLGGEDVHAPGVRPRAILVLPLGEEDQPSVGGRVLVPHNVILEGIYDGRRSRKLAGLYSIVCTSHFPYLGIGRRIVACAATPGYSPDERVDVGCEVTRSYLNGGSRVGFDCLGPD